MARNTQQQSRASNGKFQSLVGVTVKYKNIVGGVFAFCVLVSLILAFVLPRTYEAYSMIVSSEKSVIDPLVKNMDNTPDIREELSTLTKQVLAWHRIDFLITRMHLADDKKSLVAREEYIKEFMKRIKIEIMSQNVVQISYQDHDPVKAQQVVNALTEDFINENADSNKVSAQKTIAFISEQLKIYKDKLSVSQRDFNVNKLESDLRQALNRKMLIEERLEKLQQLIPTQITKEVNPVISRLQGRQGELETELARLMVDAKEGNPKVTELKKQIEEIRNKVSAEMSKENVKESVSISNPAYMQSEQELKQVEIEIDYLQQRKKELEIRGGKTAQVVSDDDLANIERGKTVDEDIYQMLLRQLQSAYVTEHLQETDKGGRFRIIEYARVPTQPVKPSRVKLLLIGMLSGISLSMGFVFFVDNLDKSYRTPEDAKSEMQYRYLGAISRMVEHDRSHMRKFLARAGSKLDSMVKRNSILSGIQFMPSYQMKAAPGSPFDPRLIMFHDPQSRVAEEYRVLRTNILNVKLDVKLKALMLTSTLHGEGKSTTAANLAVAMAYEGRRTLLVDCDIRKGVMHEIFGLKQSPGVSDILDEKTTQDCIIKTSIKNLSVLPRGSNIPHPSELLGSEMMGRLMEDFRKEFDFLVFDAPPALNLPDVSILGKHMDGIMLVVQAERTQRSDVQNAASVVTNASGKLIGYVMTNVQYYMPRYVYDYYYREMA